MGRLSTQFVGPTKISQSSETLMIEYNRRAALRWMTPLLALAMAAYAFIQNAGSASLIWPSVAIAICLIWTTAKADPNSRLHNVSALLLIGAATLAVFGALKQNGFSLMGVELTLLVSCLAIITGGVLKSRPAVMLSALTTLAYLASLFPNLGFYSGLTDGVSKLGIGIVPILVLFQVSLSQNLKSHLILGAATIAGYIWLLLLANDMPMNAIAGLGFALGSAHYCLGKAGSSDRKFGSKLHILFGTIFALLGAFYVQSLWMPIETGQAIPFWPPNSVWWSLLGCAMLTLFISLLKRYKSSQISLIGIFIIGVGAAALPLSTAKPDLVHSTFDLIPGLNAFPGFGLIIGAILIAFGLIWIIAGLKAGILLKVVIGATVIGLEALILYNPGQLNMDFAVIFAVALICALCVGGLVAGSSREERIHAEQYA